MPFDLSDNLLLLATCIGLYISYYTIKNTLQDVKDATRVPEPVPNQPKPRQLDPNAEDNIDAKTLRTLSRSPNVEVRNAAIKIFIARAAKLKTRIPLLRDLRSLNHERRENAINGLWLLIYGVDLNDVVGNGRRQQELQNGETYENIVRALVNLLPEHKRVLKGKMTGRWALEVPPSPIRPIRRPAHEFSLLIMLTFLMASAQNIFDNDGNRRDPVGVALEAGLVTEWLVGYPFPCSLPEYERGNFKKSDVVSLFENVAYANDDNLMSGVMGMITRSPRGMKELRKAGLTTSTFKEDVKSLRRRRSYERQDDETDIMMVGGEDTAGALSRWRAVDATGNGPRPRSLERSHEEDRLRRRHREAVVVADRGEPLSRENILQRADSEAGIMHGGFLGGGDEDEERESLMSFSEDNSMPSLEEPIDRSLNESPQSYRSRISARRRSQNHSSRGETIPNNLGNPQGPERRASFEEGWDFQHDGTTGGYDVPD